jgi:hypothetical protein
MADAAALAIKTQLDVVFLSLAMTSYVIQVDLWQDHSSYIPLEYIFS